MAFLALEAGGNKSIGTGLFWKYFFIPVTGFGFSAVFGGYFEVVMASMLAFLVAFSLPGIFEVVLGAMVLGAIKLLVVVWILIVPNILVFEDWLVTKILSLVTILGLVALLHEVTLALLVAAVFIVGFIILSVLVYSSFSSSQLMWMLRISKTLVRT